MTRILFPLLALPLLSLSASAYEAPMRTGAQREPEPVDQDLSSAVEPSPQEIKVLVETMERAIREDWRELHLLTRCAQSGSPASIEVFSNGVAVWNMRSQLRMPPKIIRQMLSELLAADFAAMPSYFGGQAKPLSESSRVPPAAVEVGCQIALRLDGIEKSVIQMRKGDQSVPLLELSATLVELARPFLGEAITPNGFQDAMAKVASGEIAPELFGLSVQKRPIDFQEGGGWRMVIRGSKAEASVKTRDSAEVLSRSLVLEPQQIRALGQSLADSHWSEMPVNLWAETYRDLSAGVMRWRKSIQARQFDGMQPGDLGDRQEAFDALIAELERLASRVMQEGSPPPPSSAQ